MRVSRFIYFYAECHYAECRYAECRGAVICILLGIIIWAWVSLKKWPLRSSAFLQTILNLPI